MRGKRWFCSVPSSELLPGNRSAHLGQAAGLDQAGPFGSGSPGPSFQRWDFNARNPSLLVSQRWLGLDTCWAMSSELPEGKWTDSQACCPVPCCVPGCVPCLLSSTQAPAGTQTLSASGSLLSYPRLGCRPRHLQSQADTGAWRVCMGSGVLGLPSDQGCPRPPLLPRPRLLEC